MSDPLAILADSWNYLVVICLMMGGLFIVISQQNLCEKAGWSCHFPDLRLSVLHLGWQGCRRHGPNPDENH